ncbi:MAG: hypothetical protein KAH07_07830 [Flavobacteriaceae bacterium]|nr:hypothetical protein [Flavobacteriaceae bacterium]
MKLRISNLLMIATIVSSAMLISCNKDDDNSGNNPPSIGETGTFTDSRDSHVYKWVEIGNQVWMVENLSYTGTGIQNITDELTWYDNSDADAWAYYDNSTSKGSEYGVLYQWEAAKTACPDGWHLPTNAEWLELENYLKDNGYSYDGTVGSNEIAKSLANNSGWKTSKNLGSVGNSDFTNFINTTGFTALPSGYRAYTGEFVKLTEEGYWWSSTEDSNGNYGNRKLSFDSTKIWSFNDNKKYGFSVRCIKD